MEKSFKAEEKLSKALDDENKKEISFTHPGQSRTSFYFTFFSEEFGAKQMYEVFQEYNEVVIPSKRDNRGIIYCLVRLFKVKDVDLLSTKLDNIFLGNMKIFVNISCFQGNNLISTQNKHASMGLQGLKNEGV